MISKKVILRAKEAYDRVPDDNRCNARARYCDYWASASLSDRKMLISRDCLPAARRLIHLLTRNEAQLSTKRDLARAYSEYIEYLLLSCDMCSERIESLEIVREAKSVGKNAFHSFAIGVPASPDDIEATILVLKGYAQFLFWATGRFLDDEGIRQICLEVLPATERLANIVEKIESTSLRGTGKTVLLDEYNRICRERNSAKSTATKKNLKRR